MFGKKRLLGVAVFVLFVAVFVGGVWADYSINSAHTVNFLYPLNNQIYMGNVSSFNWSLYIEGWILNGCFYSYNNNTLYSVECYANSTLLPYTANEGYYNIKFYVNVSDGSDDYLNYLDITRFYVDTIAPTVSFVSPTAADGSWVNANTIYANVSVVEGNPKNITYTLYNSSWSNVSVFSMANQFSNITFNWSGLADGTYYYNVSVIDVAGRFNSTETRQINLDTAYPLISYAAGIAVDGANLSQSFVFAEVDATELNEKNISFNLYNSTGALINSNGTAGQRNMTWNVPDGTYYYNVSVVDYAGNTNQTETRRINLDATAPNITLTYYPQNNKPFSFSENNKSVDFNVSDMSLIVNCSFASDLLNLTNYSISAIGNNFSLENLAPGRYGWQIVCVDSFGNIGTSESYNFTILADLTFPAGTNSTNLTAENDISNVTNYFVQNDFGMINWSVSLDLSRGLDWAGYINISFNSVDVNSSGAPELNGAAIVTLNNVSWSSPQILKNGAVCSDCSIISYENYTLVFNVTGFSVYTSQETPTRSTSSGGGGGGSSCTTTWTCTEWSSCVNSVQTRSCSKKAGYCNTLVAKPAESQSCISSQQIASVPEVSGGSDVEVPGDSGIEGGSSKITGAAIGGGKASSFALIALLVIGMAYAVVYVRRQRSLKSFRERVFIEPYDLREKYR